MIKTMLSALVAATLLAGCQTTTQQLVAPGTTVYGSNEVGRAIRTTENCRIASVRQVAINGNSYADQRRAQSRDTTGLLAGGVIGAALGSQFGGGDGRKVATALGAIGGAAVGRAVAEDADARSRIRTGIEYTVDVGRDRRVIVQEYDGRVLPAGGGCRLIGNGNNVRVLPR